MQYNWHWKVLLEAEPGGTGTYLQYLIVGLGWTLATALAAWVIALTIGAIIGTVRTTPVKWLVRAGDLYVEVFRNIPLIVQMFLWFFVVPELLPQAIGDWIKQMPPPWGSYVPAVMCLAIFTSVRVAEQVRAGINSLPRGQRMAGIATGLTEAQAYRYVILPQSFRIILPPLTSEFMNIIKNSSVALTIGLLELTGRARHAGVQLPRLRGLHRGDGDLSPHQSLRRAPDAGPREKGARPGADLGRRQRTSGTLGETPRCSRDTTSTSSSARWDTCSARGWCSR